MEKTPKFAILMFLVAPVLSFAQNNSDSQTRADSLRTQIVRELRSYDMTSNIDSIGEREIETHEYFIDKREEPIRQFGRGKHLAVKMPDVIVLGKVEAIRHSDAFLDYGRTVNVLVVRSIKGPHKPGEIVYINRICDKQTSEFYGVKGNTMLKKLRIQNFKGWQDTGKIDMAPITLFFGANSSGKSSIGQFLMMLKQTVESPDRKVVFYPGGQNSAVQLGSYQEMVFRHDLKNKIAFEYQWSLRNLKIKDPIYSKDFSGDTLSFNAQIGINNQDKYSPFVETFKYHLMNGNQQTLSVELFRVQSQYKVNAEPYNLVRKQMRAWPLKEIVRFYGFSDAVVAYYQNAEFLQELNLEQEKLFHSIFYLGPFRVKADRLYTWGGINPESVGFAGENTITAILAARKRRINFRPYMHYKSIEEIIALNLKKMGLIEEFKVNQIHEQRQEYEVRLRTKGSRDWVDLPDVGFGISQVLPVLVQCFYAPRGSIILMEQPEIHLHPSAQSALADVMIDVIKSRESNANRNIQLIIETHSEHFLRRLQRRIAEGALPQEMVSVYFANIDKPPAKLEPLEIDEYGNIQNWPKNFFGDEMGDITAQAKAAMKKRMREK